VIGFIGHGAHSQRVPGTEPAGSAASPALTGKRLGRTSQWAWCFSQASQSTHVWRGRILSHEAAVPPARLAAAHHQWCMPVSSSTEFSVGC
jgi:hypothetical protein